MERHELDDGVIIEEVQSGVTEGREGVVVRLLPRLLPAPLRLFARRLRACLRAPEVRQRTPAACDIPYPPARKLSHL